MINTIAYKFQQIDKRLIFTVYSFLYIFLIFLTDKYIITYDLFYNTYENIINADNVQNFFQIQNEYKWILYIVLPIAMLIKILLITLILFIGCILFDVEIFFRKCFKITLLSEAIFILSAIFKFIWFKFFVKDFGMLEFQNFYPFSALNLFRYDTLDKWLIYPLQTLNLFEVAFWFILAYGLYLVTKQTYKKSLAIVFSSYIPGLILWLAFITFLTLNFS